MNNWWGFERKEKKRINIFKWWKASLFFVIFTILLSFFSITNDVVYADKSKILDKIENFKKLSFIDKNNIPYQVANFVIDYKKWKNILKNTYFFDFTQENLWKILSILWYSSIKNQIIKIYNQVKPFRKDIFNLLWKNWEKTYLVILENTDEERPDGGFFGSFIELTLSGGHIKKVSINDSYKVIFDQCKIKWKNWYKKCDKKKLHIYHNLPEYKKLFTYTSFLSSNYFGFTKINAENIINHYKKAYPHKKIDGVIFVKSDILQYLLPDGEKIIWKMEVINYKNLILKRLWKLNSSIKKQYMDYLKKLIKKNKKKIIKNFILNYEKIRKQWLIRLYFKWISSKFEKFLEENNFVYYNDNKSAYLFFYNVWDNKSSKFVDHIVDINQDIYVNPTKLPLIKWKNIIKYKNIFVEKPEYYDFLKKENVSESSFLWWKDTKNYDVLLIVPRNCKKYKVNKWEYIVDCK